MPRARRLEQVTKAPVHERMLALGLVWLCPSAEFAIKTAVTFPGGARESTLVR